MELNYATDSLMVIRPPSRWSNIAIGLAAISLLVAVAGPLLVYFQQGGFHRFDWWPEISLLGFLPVWLAGITCGTVGLVRSGSRQRRAIFGIAMPIAAMVCGFLFLIMAALGG